MLFRESAVVSSEVRAEVIVRESRSLPVCAPRLLTNPAIKIDPRFLAFRDIPKSQLKAGGKYGDESRPN
jgi:hypothetical protein